MRKILFVLISFILIFSKPNIVYANNVNLDPNGKMYLLSILSSNGLYVDTDDLNYFFDDLNKIAKYYGYMSDFYKFMNDVNDHADYFLYNLLFKNDDDYGKAINTLSTGPYGLTGGGGASRTFMAELISSDVKNLDIKDNLIFDYNDNIVLSKKITNKNGVYFLDLYKKGSSVYPFATTQEGIDNINYNSVKYNYDKYHIKVNFKNNNNFIRLYINDDRNVFYLDENQSFKFIKNKPMSFFEESGYMNDDFNMNIPNLYVHIYSYKNCFVEKSLEVPFYSTYNYFFDDKKSIDNIFNKKASYITQIFDENGTTNFDLSRIKKCIPFSKFINRNEKKDYNYIFNYSFYDYFNKSNNDGDYLFNKLKTMKRSLNDDVVKDFNEYLHGNLNNDIDRGYYILDKDIIKYKKVDKKIDNDNKECCICNIDYSLIDKIVKKNLSKYYENNIITIANNVENLKADINYLKNNINKIDDIDNTVNKINTKIDNLKSFDKSNLVGSDEFKAFKNQYNNDIKLINEKLDNNKLNNLSDDDKKHFINNLKDSFDFFGKLKKFFENFFTITEKFDFKKIDSSKLYQKIPFSIFYDLKNIFSKLVSPPLVPKFDVPIYTETIVIDFNKFENLAVIVRSFIMLYVIIFLVMMLYKKVG